ncbi:hypothetical protein LTR53_011172 [Teratosphaeriaceae sp. CCFEE 6253]|nr:hypothetical protein LTR53_011172 [Teratosphaeriaceae sp. CCFEE 6253]
MAKRFKIRLPNVDMALIMSDPIRSRARRPSHSSTTVGDMVGGFPDFDQRRRIGGGLGTSEGRAGLELSESDEVEETSLTLAFQFRALVNRCADKTLQTLEFDALSDDLAAAINDLKAGWEAKALRTMKKAWPAVFGLLLSAVNQCAQMKIDNGGLSRWTHLDPKFLACKTCANMARFCFKQHGQKLYLLPLPEAVRAPQDPTLIGYYKLPEPMTISWGANKPHKDLWPSESITT